MGFGASRRSPSCPPAKVKRTELSRPETSPNVSATLVTCRCITHHFPSPGLAWPAHGGLSNSIRAHRFLLQSQLPKLPILSNPKVLDTSRWAIVVHCSTPGVLGIGTSPWDPYTEPFVAEPAARYMTSSFSNVRRVLLPTWRAGRRQLPVVARPVRRATGSEASTTTGWLLLSGGGPQAGLDGRQRRAAACGAARSSDVADWRNTSSACAMWGRRFNEDVHDLQAAGLMAASDGRPAVAPPAVAMLPTGATPPAPASCQRIL